VWKGRCLLLGAVLAFAVLSAAGILSQEVSADSHVLEVQLDEWTVGFDELELAAGRTQFQVVNNGRMPHNFVIEWTNADGERLALETPVLQPGEEYRLIVSLAPGTYQALCTISGHADLGMSAPIVVQ